MIPARYRPFAVCVDAMIYENIDITVKKVRLQKNFGKNVQNAAKYLAMSKKSSTFAPSNEKTNMKRPAIVHSVQTRLHQVLPDAEVLLYGSEARGDARPDSDIDLLVLLDKEHVSFADRMAVIDSLEDISLRTNTEISPVIHTKRYWESRPMDMFKYNVQHEGIRL